ncbi:hypothetical protein OG21DRAFT_845450 [Imleria badia]|nr:hypothetical protein OG21DRAFT_845450 [Imleria badia]
MLILIEPPLPCEVRKEASTSSVREGILVPQVGSVSESDPGRKRRRKKRVVVEDRQELSSRKKTRSLEVVLESHKSNVQDALSTVEGGQERCDTCKKHGLPCAWPCGEVSSHKRACITCASRKTGCSINGVIIRSRRKRRTPPQDNDDLLKVVTEANNQLKRTVATMQLEISQLKKLIDPSKPFVLYPYVIPHCHGLVSHFGSDENTNNTCVILH